jgi:hypothetical protein
MTNGPAQVAFGLRFDRPSPAGYAALVLALAALWILGRRYSGITNDAILYVAQGLRRLDPSSLDKDLFFAHGSQDAYTVFPALYAPLIEALGAGGAAMAVTIAGQVAFLAAATVLVFRVAAGPARWWSIALLAASSGYYGGVGVFRLAEPFATARTLAEPLVLAALACTLASRHRSAFATLAAAAALHPLMAAPGIVVVFLWHALARPRLLWALPILLALTLAVVVMRPELLQRLDPPWLAVILDRTPHLLVSQWLLPDWARFLWGLCVAWLAAGFVQAPARRLVLATAVTGLAGVAASWIAVDLSGNAFAASLQLWRAHWPMHFFAIVLVPVAVAGLWRSGESAPAARAAAACLAASCCFGRGGLAAAGMLAIGAVILDASQRRWPGWMSTATLRLILLGTVSAALAGLLADVLARLPSPFANAHAPAWNAYVHAVGSVGGLLPLAALLWLAACSRIAVLGAGVAAAALALSVAAWDARAPWPRFIEQASMRGNPFRDLLAPGVQVFWPGSYGRTWLVLGRPTWFSPDQGAGVVFHRATALAYAERRRAASALQSAVDACTVAGQPGCRIEAGLARDLCSRQGGPEYLVLNAIVGSYRAVGWPLPPESGSGGRSLFLYACRDIIGADAK